MQVVGDIQLVARMTYNAFEPVDADKPARLLTARDRYNEAIRATHKICAELADLEDAEEFNALLSFLEKQW